jgi:predicted class III extradiol MEMO1 family dioxygenase
LESFTDVELHHRLFEALIELHDEHNDRFLVSAGQFTAWLPYENIKEDDVKSLENLDWVWFANRGACTYLGEKTDHICGDMIWILCHESPDEFSKTS